MAERMIPFTNFKDGIGAVPAFFGGDIRDILNQDINDTGWLVPRKGMNTLENRVLGTYPRSVTRIFKADAADATDNNHIFFDSTTLKLGIVDSPSLIGRLNDDTELRIVSGNSIVALQVEGTTLTVIQQSTQILTFQAALSGGSGVAFEDDEEVTVIILLDEDERDIYLENDNRPKYSEGDQLIVAHYLGESDSDAITRYYKVSKDTHHTSIRKGQVLLLADGENKHFIDVINNRRYDWDLSAPYILNATRATYSADFRTLRALLVNNYQNNSDFRDKTSVDGFPLEALQDSTDNVEIEAFRAVFYDSELQLQSKASNTFLRIYNLDPLLVWLSDINIADDTGTFHNTRYAAMQADGLLDSDDVANIIEALDIQEELDIDITDRPDWATRIEIYSSLLSQSLLLSTDVETDNINEGEIAGTVFTGIGTGLSVAAQIAANSFFLNIGLVLTVTGLLSFYLGGKDNEGKRFEIDRQGLGEFGDEGFKLISTEIIDTVATRLFVGFDILPVDSGKFLDTFYNVSPPEKLDAIALHAGRVYGVNRETEEIVFSHIDGNGISNYWSFPPANAIPTSASGISPVEKIEKMPGSGGLYVFKRDSIHYIDGQNIFSGLYDISVSAQTDISADDYKKNIGCISPRSVKNDGDIVLFVGSDDQIYQMNGKQAIPIGVSVKPFIEGLTLTEQRDIVTEWHNERFYLTLPDSVLILNVERKYWTRFDWDLKDILWSRGGKTAESLLYGLTDADILVELQVDNPDEVFPIKWERNVSIRQTGTLLTAVYVYTDNGEEVTVTVSGNEPDKEVVRTFIPKLGNKYRAGTHVKGRNIEIKVESDNPITIDRIDLEENI